MAATSTTNFPIPAAQPALSATRVRAGKRRIDPQSGRALEILAHAIEYLTDEFVEEGGHISASDARVQAVQLLMAMNRQVYYDCPVVPSLAERCRAFFRSVAA